MQRVSGRFCRIITSSVLSLLVSRRCNPSHWIRFLTSRGSRVVRPLTSLRFGDDYHLGRGHIAASMKLKLYHFFRAQSIKLLYAVQMPHMIFTGLEDYKARGTQAAPYSTVTYYTEFAESKDVGDVVFTSKLSDSEAKWIMEKAQSFYLNDIRYKLVECFNKATREFEFKDVLQALDMPVL